MAELEYDQGTVSVSAGGTVVTGNLTMWSGVHVRQWDSISIDGSYPMPIRAVADLTHLTIPPWNGVDKTNVGYVIYQFSPLRYVGGQAVADVDKLIAWLDSQGLYLYVPTSATDPTSIGMVADDGQYALQAVTGKVWLMEGGVWVFIGVFKAVSDKGKWLVGTAYALGDIVTRNGKLYQAKLAGAGHPPESSPTYWEVYLNGGDRYDLASFDTDRPASGEMIVKIYPYGITFPAGLTNSQAGAEVVATSVAVFSIKKNGVQFATLTFAAGSAVGVFACAADTTFGTGDVLRLIAPNPRDATLSGVAATIIGYR